MKLPTQKKSGIQKEQIELSNDLRLVFGLIEKDTIQIINQSIGKTWEEVERQILNRI